MPRIVECSGAQKRFRMHGEDLYAWEMIEDNLYRASECLRFDFAIPGVTPPLPSKFGYSQGYRSKADAEKTINLSRDWFSIWMGFLSYLIAQVQIYGYSRDTEKTHPLPFWYRHLLARDFPEPWLNGISTSAVCSFSEQNPRCGIVLDVMRMAADCPSIRWFIYHKLPLWFVWTKTLEVQIRQNPEYRYLQPPNDLIERALKFLDLSSPNLPLVSLILTRYSGRLFDFNREVVKVLRVEEASSYVMQKLSRILLNSGKRVADDETLRQVNELHDKNVAELHHAAAAAAAALPTQGMLEKQEDYHLLYNDYKEFFEVRERRRTELERVQTPKQRQQCASRKANPPIKSVNMYEWKKIQTSGGKVVYVRTRVVKRKNETVYFSYGSHERRYDPFNNEWDFCKEFSGKSPVITGYTGSDSEEDDDGFSYPIPSNEASRLEVSSPEAVRPHTPSRKSPGPRTPLPSLPGPSTPPGTPPTDINFHSSMDVDPPCEEEGSSFHSSDMLVTLQRVYGYVPTMGIPVKALIPLSWEHIPVTLGFTSKSSFADVQDQDKDGIRLFIHRLLKDYGNIPGDLDDLNDASFAPLTTLFDWKHITRTPGGLFVFHTPLSSACCWSLGVKSASVAIYVCRLILSNPLIHTILTVAHHLLSRCIRFQTLLRVESTTQDKCLSKIYSPDSFRREDYRFTELDFDSAMLHSKNILQRGGGRAAMLRGGILSRIAQEFLSLDGVLDGPSAEVTVHRTGFVTPAEWEGYSYWDDDLTEHEIAIVIGTYSMYTGEYLFIFNAIVLINLIGNGDQTTIVSWFPPPSLWEHSDCGLGWLEWREKAEKFFLQILSDNRSGKGQPISKAAWRNRVRGHVNNRLVTANNEKRCLSYLEKIHL